MESNDTLWTNSSITSSSATWTLGPVSTAIITPIAIILNSYVLYTFSVNSFLYTPFNVYLGSLMLANLVYSIICNPLDIISGLYPTWPLSSTACDVYIYALCILGAVTINSHALITANRLWAMTFPVSYRAHHHNRTALLTVFGLWIYVHIVCLPGVIRDSVYFRKPLADNPCALNVEAQFAWNMVMQFGIYDLPILFVVLAYPYLLVKHKSRTKVRLGNSIRLSRSARTGDENRSRVAQVSGGSVGRKKASAMDDRNRAFVVTSMLTVAIVICWAPNVTFFTVGSFMAIDDPVMFGVSSFLFNLQSLFDPILFALVFKSLRDALLLPLKKLTFLPRIRIG